MNPDQIERDYQKALRRIREAKDTRATSLDLSGLIWDRLPPELFELTWLEELALQQNDEFWDEPEGTIPLLPLEFSRLLGLRHLNISKLGVQNLVQLAALKELTTPHSGYNQLTNLAVIGPAVLNGQIQTLRLFNNPVCVRSQNMVGVGVRFGMKNFFLSIGISKHGPRPSRYRTVVRDRLHFWRKCIRLQINSG